MKNRSRVVPPGTAGAAEAVLTCRAVRRENGRALLEVKPETGRPHQIRVQLAARGWPIVGDVKYGGPPLPAADGGRSIALHAAALEVEHPTKKTPVRVAAAPPEAWTRYGLPTP